MESILGYVDNLRMIPLAFNRSNNEVSTNKSLSLHHAQHSWMQPRIWCLPQRVARRHESIIRHSGQAMARSSIMVDNVPLFIQLGIDTPTQSLGLTTTHFKVLHRKMPQWGNPRQVLEELHGVRLPNSQALVDQTFQLPPEKGGFFLTGNEIKESQILEVQGPCRHLRRIWEQRPVWMRTIYSGDEGDHTVLETVANVATSLPFVLIGLQVPRNKLSNTLYANSLIGVGLASTLYHTSRGEVRKGTRWGDYAMIATSTMCMSAAVQKDKSPSRGLMLASICMLPFQPMLVTAIHAGLVEATFARKVFKDPKLRGVLTLHTASTLVGGALFVADDIYPDKPYLHAGWHLAAAMGVMTINSLIE